MDLRLFSLKRRLLRLRMDGQHCKERVKNKVSILGNIELYGDGRDVPTDQGSYYQICAM
jgi:hypothetical protein